MTNDGMARNSSFVIGHSISHSVTRSRSVAGRKVVFVGDEIAMPDGIEALLETISHQPVAGTRPRLRDGRWVV